MVEIKGKVWKFGDNINTDLIVPGDYLTSNVPEEIVEHAFEGVHPGFAQKVKKGDIIIAGRNFGSGSSREEAVFVVKELGISAVIAESFSRIYFRNLINQGIPTITLKNAVNIIDEGDSVEIDLKKGTVKDITKNSIYNFNPIPDFIMNFIENGGTLNLLKKNF
ncbi:MAG: LeuD/DmdB family oxidoreductase small subunit [Promethearchaeota archaeon]